MKKFKFRDCLFVSVLSTFSIMSLAHEIGSFHGLYVGVGLGGSSTSADQDQSSIVDFIAVPAFHTFSGPNSLKTDNSFKGAFFIGYGQCWNSLYLGAEIFIDVARYKLGNATENLYAFAFSDVVQINSKSKLNDVQYGIDFRPGILLTPQSMLYGRVGVSFSDLSLDTDNLINLAGLLTNQNFNHNLSEKKDVSALRLGAGLEQNLFPCLNMRFDYIYTYYGRISNALTTRHVDAQTFIYTTESEVKVYDNTVMLGLSYLFG